MKAKYVQILCDIAARGNRHPFSPKKQHMGVFENGVYPIYGLFIIGKYGH